MTTKDKYGVYAVVALFLAAVLVVSVLNGCKKGTPEPAEPAGGPNEAPVAAKPAEASADPLETATSLFRQPKASLQNIIKAAKTWQPSFEQWWGKLAPDFTLTDIDGNLHKLSSYRGKDVIVVIWTTWCPTCKLEIPHLKELYKAFDREKLAILSISNESPTLLKDFASEQKIPYTVLSGSEPLPSPFGDVEYIPSSFYIDPEGKFKLAATGLVPTGDGEAIVQAQ
ncbi:MAG: TlpA family protein disulfide reductase [Sedimentisphaerales bacterium]|nr:TlpA family protein disulfide reductase [Sedimentisphaerales bacterium]